MNFNPHTQRTLRPENESLSLGQANSSQKVSQDSESKTTHTALHCLEEQQSISAEIKKIVETLASNTDPIELNSKVANLVKKLKLVNGSEEIQNHLNHFQLNLYQAGFQHLSEKIRDRIPFAWNDLPLEITSSIVSKMDYRNLVKIETVSKEFNFLAGLEIIRHINTHKIALDHPDVKLKHMKFLLKQHGEGLRYLGLIGGKCSLRDLQEIITSCPHLEHIKLGLFPREVKIADTHAVILAKLAEESKLSHLKRLEFRPGSIKLPGVKAIAKAPLKTLISLKLVGNELGNSGFACICQSSTLINLKVLDFSHNQMASRGLQAIAEAKFKLEELYLRNNQIVSFANNLDNLQDLKILDLSENQMNREALEKILKLSQHALTQLDLSHNHLTDKTLLQVTPLENSKLRVLKLADNNISSRGIEKIALLISRLSGLHLDNNKELDSWGLKLILKEKPKLAELGLSGTSIGEEGVITIFDFENFSFLRKLNIGQIELSNKFWLSVSRLRERVHLGCNLEELNISCQENDKEKIKMLWESFPLKILIIYVPFGRREDW